jgi:bifunctional ADP-heptose synthase (sugar kinase/adenylyltransferase)
MPHEQTLITLSEEGMLLFGPGQEEGLYLPAHRRRIADVSGAGDTVIAVACAARAAGHGWEEAARLANLAGGLVCELPGVVPVDPLRLRAEWKNLGA